MPSALTAQGGMPMAGTTTGSFSRGIFSDRDFYHVRDAGGCVWEYEGMPLEGKGACGKEACFEIYILDESIRHKKYWNLGCLHRIYHPKL